MKNIVKSAIKSKLYSTNFLYGKTLCGIRACPISRSTEKRMKVFKKNKPINELINKPKKVRSKVRCKLGGLFDGVNGGVFGGVRSKRTYKHTWDVTKKGSVAIFSLDI